MPCPHNEITIVQRSQRQSAVAAAAYMVSSSLRALLISERFILGSSFEKSPPDNSGGLQRVEKVFSPRWAYF